jgi:hypothetical protein
MLLFAANDWKLPTTFYFSTPFDLISFALRFSLEAPLTTLFLALLSLSFSLQSSLNKPVALPLLAPLGDNPCVGGLTVLSRLSSVFNSDFLTEFAEPVKDVRDLFSSEKLFGLSDVFPLLLADESSLPFSLAMNFYFMILKY